MYNNGGDDDDDSNDDNDGNNVNRDQVGESFELPSLALCCE